MHEWVRNLNGAAANATNLRVTLQSEIDTNVIIQGSVLIEKASPLMPATYVSCEPGGDFAVPRNVVVDLDMNDGDWDYYVYDRPLEEPIGLSINAGEAEVIDLRVLAAAASYEWTIQLDLTVGGKHQNMVVDDDGAPFRTTGFPPAARMHVYQEGTWK